MKKGKGQDKGQDKFEQTHRSAKLPGTGKKIENTTWRLIMFADNQWHIGSRGDISQPISGAIGIIK